MKTGKPAKKRPMTIVMVSSEAAPYSKTGGLADVAGSLSRALCGLGNDVHLFTPLYRCVDRKKLRLSRKKGVEVKIPISARVSRGRIVSVKDRGVFVRFVENDAYFDRDHLYNTPAGDYADNAERFVFFCRAVLEGIKKLKIKPDIIHVNDWQTSLIPVYLKTLYKDDAVLGGVPSVLTIHNLGYQGVFWKMDWHLTGLDWSLFNPRHLEFYDKINFLKGGIVFADLLTTVSETYAREILTPDYGWGLDGALRDRSADLYGVLNGIDVEEWNPATDTKIPANYSADDLSGKMVCKQKLLAEMGLPPGDEPVLGVISRFAPQKGLDLFSQIADAVLDAGVKLVALGSGQRDLEDFFRSLARRRPDRAAVRIGYDDTLAHRIEAGADIFVMPSHYEPCGLNQMYSLAYGTAPVVRATGGLNDTVVDYNPDTGEGNGFKFSEISAEALFGKIMEAVNCYRHDPDSWLKIMKRGMREDYSWARSAGAYQRLYTMAVSGRERQGRGIVR